VTARVAISPLAYVYDGRECRGFVLARGRLGFEGFDRQERSLGLFKTAAQAANAVGRRGAERNGGRIMHVPVIPPAISNATDERAHPTLHYGNRPALRRATGRGSAAPTWHRKGK
jgi:hypothetical protein